MNLFLFFILVLRAENLGGLESTPSNIINCQGKQLPAIYFNDDYCDCPDGSDEPDTSACSPIGRFRCENAGHVPKWIKSSLVHDGICDCCDGSDEKDIETKKTDCPNTCEQEHEEYINALEENREKVAKGMERKREFIKDSEKIKAQRAVEVVELNKKVQDLEIKKDELTELEKKQKQLAEGERVLVCKSSLDKIRLWLKDLDKALENLSSMAPEAIDSVKFEINQTMVSGEKEEIKKQEPVKEHRGDTADWEYPELNDEADDLENEDSSESIQPKESIDSICQPYTDKATVWVQSLLDSVRIDQVLKTSGSEAINNHLKTKNDLSGILNTISENNRKLEDLKRKEELDFGPSGVFSALDSKCFSIDTGEYAYEMCFFGSATQKFSGMQMNLGTWSNWSGPPENPYSEVIFEHGSSCWNGPERSMKVRLSCGSEEKILSVSEPAKCEYLMNMETSALCPDTDPFQNTKPQSKEERHVDL